MPLLTASNPISRIQCRVNKVAVLVLASVGVLLGLWEAYECSLVAFGYAAGYNYASAIAIAIALCVIGLPLLIYWRLRWIGAAFIAMGIVSCAAFYGGMAVLWKTDHVAWRHEPPLVRFGPDQKASIVIYFRKSVTDKDVEEFDSSVLQRPAKPRHQGSDYPQFVSEYTRLSPSQANGYEAVSLSFFNNASSDDTQAYIQKIEADNRVLKLFFNRSPISIHSISDSP